MLKLKDLDDILDEIKNLRNRYHAQRELFISMLKDFNQIKNSKNKRPGDLYLIKNYFDIE